MAKDHGPSVKNDKQYEGLRKKRMNKSRAAAISNSPGASSRAARARAAPKVVAQRQRQRRKPVPEESCWPHGRKEVELVPGTGHLQLFFLRG